MPKLALRLLLLGCLVWLPLAITLAGEPPADGEEDMQEETAEVLDMVPGTVTQVGNFGFGLVPDSDPGTRYAPNEPLAEELQQDGLRVRFSGIVGDPDEGSEANGRGRGGGRRWGTPLEVTHIEVLDETQKDDSETDDGAR